MGLSVTYLCGCWLIAPDTAPKNVNVERPTPTTMLVSWTPLTLSEARGFVTFYTVAYTPVLNSRRRQVSQDTMYMNVSADSSSVTIVGLVGSLAYSVQVLAGTRAGQGVQSRASVAEAVSNSGNAVHIPLNYYSDMMSFSTDQTMLIGIIVGVVLAFVVVLALIIILIVIALIK